MLGEAQPEAMKAALLKIARLTEDYDRLPLNRLQKTLSDIHFHSRDALAKQEKRP